MTRRTPSSIEARGMIRSEKPPVALASSEFQPASLGTSQFIMAGLFGLGCLIAMILGAPIA
jgi:hypothetical protein